MKWNNTKLNYEELKKDVKGIGKGLFRALVSTGLAIKDTATLITTSPLRDIRDGLNEKKSQEATKTTEAKPIKTNVTKAEVA